MCILCEIQNEIGEALAKSPETHAKIVILVELLEMFHDAILNEDNDDEKLFIMMNNTAMLYSDDPGAEEGRARMTADVLQAMRERGHTLETENSTGKILH